MPAAILCDHLIGVLFVRLQIVLRPYAADRTNMQETLSLFALATIALMQDHRTFGHRSPFAVNVCLALLALGVALFLAGSWFQRKFGESCARALGRRWRGGRKGGSGSRSQSTLGLLDSPHEDLALSPADDDSDTAASEEDGEAAAAVSGVEVAPAMPSSLGHSDADAKRTGASDLAAAAAEDTLQAPLLAAASLKADSELSSGGLVPSASFTPRFHESFSS